MVTSSADSIWRRFASSAPHRRASRWLSTGSSLTSTALLAIQQIAAQRMGHDRADAYVHEGIEEASGAGKLYDGVVRSASLQFEVSFSRNRFDKHPLRHADHGFA